MDAPKDNKDEDFDYNIKRPIGAPRIVYKVNYEAEKDLDALNQKAEDDAEVEQIFAILDACLLEDELKELPKRGRIEASNADESIKSLPKRGRINKKYRSKKLASNAQLARDATLSMKAENSGGFSKKDLNKFTSTFFPNEHPQEYSRLDPLSKLLCCQWILHNYPDTTAAAHPLVFLLSPELAILKDSYLKKKIQRGLKSALGYSPLLWSTTEYKDSSEKRLKHLNFEILLYPGELKKVEQGLKKLSGLYEIDHITNKPKINADGTKKKRIGIARAVDFPIDSRNEQARLYGEFYSVYNWPGYATKQFNSRGRNRKPNARHLLLTGNSLINSDKEGEPLHCISAELNTMAAKFYAANIYKKDSNLTTGRTQNPPVKPIFGSWS